MATLEIPEDQANKEARAAPVIRDRLATLEIQDPTEHLEYNVPAVHHHQADLDNLDALDHLDQEETLEAQETLAIPVDLDNPDLLDNLDVLVLLEHLEVLDKLETQEVGELAIIAHPHVWHQDISRLHSQHSELF